MSCRPNANAFGSRAVDEALDDFIEKSRLFNVNAMTYRTIRDQGGTFDFAASAQRMNESRDTACEAYDVLRNLMRDELTTM